MHTLSGGATAEAMWNNPAVMQSLWEWYSKLPVEERMQAVAIEDPLWIRLYLLLFNQELKFRRKDRTGFYPVKREKVTRLYQRLLRRETSRPVGNVNSSSSVSGMFGGMGSAHDGEEIDVGVLGDEALLGLVHGDETAHAGGGGKRRSASCCTEDEEDDDEETGEDYEDFLAEMKSCTPDSCTIAEDPETASRRAGDMLQRHVRLCTVSSALDTLTLCASLVEDPQALHRLLCTVTKNAFLSKPMSATTIKAFSASSSVATIPSSVVITQLPPAEAPWLQERPSGEIYPLRDLLVNRLEVSLWVSFWRKVQKVSVPRPPFASFQEKAACLLAFSEKLDPAKQMALLDGLRVAQKIMQAKNSGNGGGRSRTHVNAQIMESLLFTPILWAYKDEGLSVRRVLERVQTACADCVANELLAEDEHTLRVGAEQQEMATGAQRSKPKKGSQKKKKRPSDGGVSGPKQQQQQPPQQQQQPHQHQMGQQQQPQSPQQQVQQQQQQSMPSQRRDSTPAPESSEQSFPGTDEEVDDEVEENEGPIIDEDSENRIRLYNSAAPPKAAVVVMMTNKEWPLLEGMDGVTTATAAAPRTAGAEGARRNKQEEHKKQQQTKTVMTATTVETEGEEFWEKVGPKGKGKSKRGPSKQHGQAPVVLPPPLPPSVTTARHSPVKRSSSSSSSSSSPSPSGQQQQQQQRRVVERAESQSSKASSVPSCAELAAESVEPSEATPSTAKSAPPDRHHEEDDGEEEDDDIEEDEEKGSSSSCSSSSCHTQASACHSKKSGKKGSRSHRRYVRTKGAVRSVMDTVLSRVDNAIEKSDTSSPSSSSASAAPCASSEETVPVAAPNAPQMAPEKGGSLGATQGGCDQKETGVATMMMMAPSPAVVTTTTVNPESRRPLNIGQPPSPLSSASSSPHHSPRLASSLPPSRVSSSEALHHQHQHHPLPPQNSSHHHNHHQQPRKCRTPRPSPPMRPVAIEMATCEAELSTAIGPDGIPLPLHLPSPQASGPLDRGLRSEQVEKHRRIRDVREFRRSGQHQQQQQQAPPVVVVDYSSTAGPVMLTAATLEQQDRMIEFAKDMASMRHLLTLNVESFMAKREVEMKVMRAHRQLVVDEISQIVRELWGSARVELYGSCFTGLDLASSDVDVVVCDLPTSVRSKAPASHPCSPEEAHHRCSASKVDDVPPLSTPSITTTSRTSSATVPPSPSMGAPCRSPRHSEVEELSVGGRVFFLHQLAAALEGKAWVRSMKTIDTAFIPVIKLFADPAVLGAEGSSGLMPIDISLEGPHHGGIASSLFIRDMIQPGGPYSQAVPLTLLLKTLMSQRGLNMPWGGGLSSYALMLMVMTVLQRFEMPDVAEANMWTIRRSVEEIRRKLGTTSLFKSGAKMGQHTPPPPPPQQIPGLCNGGGGLDAVSGRGGKVKNSGGGSSSSSSSHHLHQNGGGRPRSPTEAASIRLWSHFSAANACVINTSTTQPPPPQTPPPPPPPSSVGFLLTFFLEYYGRVFNPSSEGIAVDHGFGLTFPLGPAALSADPITIVDPLDETVNVSRCCFRIGEIQWIFSQCLQLLELKGTDMARKAIDITTTTTTASVVTTATTISRTSSGRKSHHQQQAQAQPLSQQQAHASAPPQEQQQQEKAAAAAAAAAAVAAEVNILGLIMSY